ncbi:MAG: exonuclease SbcCD subunit D [Prevotella sp.]|nr:exonuclease SbcCD subunit D [Prevotella sp.]
MKILHTADLHLGQVIYQNYDRSDEHSHFFRQLEKWCIQEQPDVLLLSGDVFDIQQPSASVRKVFTDFFVGLHRLCPTMHFIITAGNHDSASRLQADKAVWLLANAHIIGVPPMAILPANDSWHDDFIIRLDSGYVVALPYMSGERHEVIQSLLDKVAQENRDGKPVVMMAHAAVSGVDLLGHDMEIGKIRTVAVEGMGKGYDYLAMGHIHKPQTIGHQEDAMEEDVTYPSPVVRYSGSALHVSCDETYPHTVSMVEIDRHGGSVRIRQLRIDELRHFYVLPQDGTSFTTADGAIEAMKALTEKQGRGYVRFRIDSNAVLPSDFNQRVYDELSKYNEEWRYNPKIIWTGSIGQNDDPEQLVFQVADLQQMTDPMEFIEKTQHNYPNLDIDDTRQAFEEIKDEVLRMREEKMSK